MLFLVLFFYIIIIFPFFINLKYLMFYIKLKNIKKFYFNMLILF